MTRKTITGIAFYSEDSAVNRLRPSDLLHIASMFLGWEETYNSTTIAAALKARGISRLKLVKKGLEYDCEPLDIAAEVRQIISAYKLSDYVTLRLTRSITNFINELA
jgi:hypothetical protein